MTEETKQPHIFIATPMYGGMCTGLYTQSLLMLQSMFAANNIKASISFMFNESLITRGRNALTSQFMASDCTHMLFIDSDIRFNANDIMHMIEADKDVICGIYPKKEINWQSVENAVNANVDVNKLKNHTGAWVVNLVGYEGSVTVPMNQPLEVWAGGTGMMLIKRNVFEQLADSVPEYTNDVVDLSQQVQTGTKIKEYFATSIEPETNRLLSEDYHFCRIWRLHGGKIYIAPWMNLGHVGTYVFEGQLLTSQEDQSLQEVQQQEPQSQDQSEPLQVQQEPQTDAVPSE